MRISSTEGINDSGQRDNIAENSPEPKSAILNVSVHKKYANKSAKSDFAQITALLSSLKDRISTCVMQITMLL